ncbi:unnamed protein product [Arctogadus glacialis]
MKCSCCERKQRSATHVITLTPRRGSAGSQGPEPILGPRARKGPLGLKDHRLTEPSEALTLSPLPRGPLLLSSERCTAPVLQNTFSNNKHRAGVVLSGGGGGSVEQPATTGSSAAATCAARAPCQGSLRCRAADVTAPNDP